MKIERCPFCGGEFLLRDRYINGVANTKHYIRECRHCKATFAHWFRSIKKANEAWNRRADHIRDTTKMVSNADRIRSMNDEELAAYIFELGNYTEYCYGHCAYQDDDELCKVHSSRGLKQEGCIRGVIDWLQQPAETEGTE